MTGRFLLVAAASVALLGCEPVENTGDDGETASQASGNTAMPEGLNADQRLIWSTLSDNGKAQVSACMASGKSFRACAAP